MKTQLNSCRILCLVPLTIKPKKSKKLRPKVKLLSKLKQPSNLYRLWPARSNQQNGMKTCSRNSQGSTSLIKIKETQENSCLNQTNSSNKCRLRVRCNTLRIDQICGSLTLTLLRWHYRCRCLRHWCREMILLATVKLILSVWWNGTSIVNLKNSTNFLEMN